MSMLDLTKAELDKFQALTPKLNGHLQRVVDAIPYNVNPRMKATIAVAQLTAFASQFRRNIMLWDDTSVPINAISFVITGSGYGKDSSVKAAKKCFAPGYDMINDARKRLVTTAAIKAAAAAGESPAEEYDIYKSYLKPVPPIDIMPTTGPGLIQHINDIAALNLSAGFLYSGEFSDELAYNPDMMENIKILSETYDLGSKEAKYTKGIEHRSGSIDGQPVSALFVGSPGHILYDEATKKKFHVAFMSKLARRSWFCYTPERLSEPVFPSMDELIDYETKLELDAKHARDKMRQSIIEITTTNLQYSTVDITVSPEVFRLFKTYKRYNSDLADTLLNQDSTSALIRRHLQWKAIKLAGAFAIFDRQHSIQQHHYVQAIQFCELLANDMEVFEFDLSKSDHERFSDFIRTQVLLDNKAVISVHDLKKQGFVSTTTKAKLQELVLLCTAYDSSGIYSVINEGAAIQYEPIIKTDKLSISFKPLNMTGLNNALNTGDTALIKEAKHQLAINSTYGFELGQTTFNDLTNLLSGDYAYSPFTFRNGVRGKDNIVGGTKWLVYDLDNSTISASEAHFLLNDINHHIALSSDPTNEYKFRVLIELDSVVDLDPITWKHFYTSVADHLALRIDVLPQSQIFFSYAGRPIMSVTDGSPLEVRSFIIDAKDKRTASAPKPLTTAQQRALLADPLTVFAYAFECPLNGPGLRSLIRMAYHAHDLGASTSEIIDLIHQVNDYWEIPLDDTRLARLEQQVSRMF